MAGWGGGGGGQAQPAIPIPPSHPASIALIPSLKADLHILNPTEPGGQAAVEDVGSRSAGSHISRSLLILTWEQQQQR